MTSVPASHLYASAQETDAAKTTENLYTEVSNLSDVRLLIKQRSNASLTPGSLQKSFPPLPPIPPCLKLPLTSTPKQIVKSSSLHCILNGNDRVLRRDVLKVSSIDCLGTKEEQQYDDIVVANMMSINASASHEDHEEYQLMLKSADNVDVIKTALECKVMLLASKNAEMQNELQLTKRSLAECKKMVSDLYESVRSVQLQLESVSSHHKTDCTDVDSDATALREFQTNRARLSTMSTEELLSLLTAIGLGRYRKKFQKEKINGRFLLECDEEMLLTCLGITNKLHRIRLMMYITGKQCVQTAFEKKEVY